MVNKYIDIEGVVSQKEINQYKLNYPRKEVCLNFQLKLSDEEKDIDKIDKIILKHSISENKGIETQGKYKNFFHGFIDITIIYISSEDSKKYSSNMRKSFASFIPVEIERDNDGEIIEKDTIMFVEEALINESNRKEVCICLLMLICTIDRKVNMYREFKNKENRVKSLNVMEEETKQMLENIEDKDEVKEKSIKLNNDKLEDVDVELEYDMQSKNKFIDLEYEIMEDIKKDTEKEIKDENIFFEIRWE